MGWEGGGVGPHRVLLLGCLVGGRYSPGESPGQPLATVQSIQTAPFQRQELHPMLPGQAKSLEVNGDQLGGRDVVINLSIDLFSITARCKP